MEILAIILLFIVAIGIPLAAIAGAGAIQYTPLSPDQEEAMLREDGLTEDEIKEIMELIP